MTRHARGRPLIALCAVMMCAVAGADDSDGYYCVGQGYLAWQTRGFGDDERHRLHVIGYHDASGIGAAQHLALPTFQLIGLRCGAAEITFYSAHEAIAFARADGHWSARGSSQPADLAAAGQRYAPRRFGDTPELRLPAAGNSSRFVLLSDLRAQRFGTATEYTTLVRVMHFDQHRRLLDSRVVFAESVVEGAAPAAPREMD